MEESDGTINGGDRMNIAKNAAELLERYLKAVEGRLPLSKRGDISREIESMVLDICDERYGETEIDIKRMESVLVELGSPSKLAVKYRDHSPLIGPELMPLFKMIIIIVCLVTSVVSLINFAFTAGDMSFIDAGLYLLELFSSLTSVIGTIFLVFIILERTVKNKSDFDIDDEKWKIKDLPEIDSKLPGKGEIIATIIFSVIFITALNVFTDRIGIYSFGETFDSDFRFFPLLTDRAVALIPVFSIRLALGAAVLIPLIGGVELFREEKRNYYYQISQMGLIIFDIALLILLLSGGFAAFIRPEAFAESGIDGVLPIASKIYTGVLILLLGLSGWSLVKRTLVILPKGRV